MRWKFLVPAIVLAGLTLGAKDCPFSSSTNGGGGGVTVPVPSPAIDLNGTWKRDDGLLVVFTQTGQNVRSTIVGEDVACSPLVRSFVFDVNIGPNNTIQGRHTVCSNILSQRVQCGQAGLREDPCSGSFTHDTLTVTVTSNLYNENCSRGAADTPRTNTYTRI